MKHTKFISKTVLVCAMLLLFYTCKRDSGNHMVQDHKKTRQDSLAFELCKIYGADQGIRDMKLITRKETGALKFSPHLDSINFYKIMDFVKEHGMPSKELLGEDNFSHECVEGAFVAVLLHTPHILINDREYLDLLLNEVNQGNLKMKTLITILDKYYLVRRDKYGNRKLLYGSQFGKPCRKYHKESDSVRAVVGLPPLPDSLFIDCKTSK